MVSFRNPATLLLLLLIPPLILWWLYRPRRALQHSLPGRLLHLSSPRARWVRRAGALLRGLALVLLVLALAGLRWPDQRSRIETEGIALVMLVDISGSMAEPDFTWHGRSMTRLDAVRKVFQLFVLGSSADDGSPGDAPAGDFPGRPTDLVGLVVFATRPETLCPLTLSHSVLVQMLERQEVRAVPGESETNLSDAIALGLHRLQAAPSRRKVLILLSDGEHNVPHPQSAWSPRAAARVAAALQVPIYTLDAGNGPAGDREPKAESTRGSTGVSPAIIRSEAVQTLSDLADITGGHYFAAHDTDALLAACRDIDRLERTPIQSFQYRRHHEAYPWLALGSLLSYSLALLLEQTLGRRLP